MANPVEKEYFYEKLIRMMGSSEHAETSLPNTAVSKQKQLIRKLKGMLIAHYERKLVILSIVLCLILVLLTRLFGHGQWIPALVFGVVAFLVILWHRFYYFVKLSAYRRSKYNTSDLLEAYQTAIDFKIKKINAERFGIIFLVSLALMCFIAPFYSALSTRLFLLLLGVILLVSCLIYFRLNKILEKIASNNLY